MQIDLKNYIYQRMSFMQLYKKLKLTLTKKIESNTNLGPDSEQIRAQSNLLDQCFSDQYYRNSQIFHIHYQDQEGKFLDGSVYFDFVDRYMIKNLRDPDVLLPVGLVEADMQGAFRTQFQAYVYCRARESCRKGSPSANSSDAFSSKTL